ncbi:MAG: 3-deoxy-manno-octulosonate cytidylyltransferase [Bauldia sp.]|nr:3-deoxy-manno-octulosonate cytidylyltransferase [Bauldia sp.]
MPVSIVIPARYGSSRFPGKPLVPLRGAAGRPKTLIRRCIEAARAVAGVDRVVVATDDVRIVAEAEAAGAAAAMTDPALRNGSERVAAAAAALGIADGIVVNLQGDAPLIPPWFVEELVAAMEQDPGVGMATPVLRCDPESLRMFREDRAAGRVGATTAVIARNGDALYFSKEVIPFTGDRTFASGAVPVFHHVGLYAFRPEALAAYAAMEPTPLERLEGLEQLRFLEHGRSIRTVEVDGRGRPFWEVNNPEDVPRVEAQLARLGID